MGIHNSKQLRSVLSLEIGEQPRDLESISILHNDRDELEPSAVHVTEVPIASTKCHANCDNFL